MMKRKIPLLKEYRLDKLVKCLGCFDEHKYNRRKQRDCILMEYDMSQRADVQHWDKSVFRGMVIPSLKYLGFLYGEKDEYLLSANGNLLLQAKKKYESKYKLILKTIIKDLDDQKFGFLLKIPSHSTPKDEIINLIGAEIDIEKEKSRIERINKWLNILKQACLIDIEKKNIKNTSDDFEVNKIMSAEYINLDMFISSLWAAYDKLASDSAGVVKIENLRKNVLIDFLGTKNIIIISSIFDELFNKIPLNSENYSISLGKPMRAKEGLYLLGGNYFDTIHIKFHNRK